MQISADLDKEMKQTKLKERPSISLKSQSEFWFYNLISCTKRLHFGSGFTFIQVYLRH